MKNKAIFIAVLILAFSCRLAAQARYGGYFSFEYLQGQSQSPYSRGSVENLGGGLFSRGEILPKVAFSFEARLRDASRLEMEQAWVGFVVSQALQVKAGLFLVPFGRFNQSNRPHETPVIRSPLNLQDAYPSSWRDIGLCFEGRSGFLVYSAYIGNGMAEGEDLGAGQQFKDNNKDKGKGGRLGLILGRGMEAGVSYYTGKYDPQGERTLKLLGADARWVSESWEIWAEYTKATAENPSPSAHGETEGFFAHVIMNWGKIRPWVGFQKSRYEDEIHGLGFSPPASGLGILKDRRRWALGAVYAVTPNLLIKAEYDLNKERDLALKDNLFQAQVAVSF
jgi:hypothetical protein